MLFLHFFYIFIIIIIIAIILSLCVCVQIVIRSEKQQEQRVKNRTRIDFRSGNAQQSKSGSTSSSSAPGVSLSSGHSISAANPNIMLQRLQNAASNLHADTSRGSIPYLGNPGFPGPAYPGAAPILAPFNDANQMMPPMHSHIMRVSSTGSCKTIFF